MLRYSWGRDFLPTGGVQTGLHLRHSTKRPALGGEKRTRQPLPRGLRASERQSHGGGDENDDDNGSAGSPTSLRASKSFLRRRTSGPASMVAARAALPRCPRLLAGRSAKMAELSGSGAGEAGAAREAAAGGGEAGPGGLLIRVTVKTPKDKEEILAAERGSVREVCRGLRPEECARLVGGASGAGGGAAAEARTVPAPRGAQLSWELPGGGPLGSVGLVVALQEGLGL